MWTAKTPHRLGVRLEENLYEPCLVEGGDRPSGRGGGGEFMAWVFSGVQYFGYAPCALYHVGFRVLDFRVWGYWGSRSLVLELLRCLVVLSERYNKEM